MRVVWGFDPSLLPGSPYPNSDRGAGHQDRPKLVLVLDHPWLFLARRGRLLFRGSLAGISGAGPYKIFC